MPTPINDLDRSILMSSAATVCPEDEQTFDSLIFHVKVLASLGLSNAGQVCLSPCDIAALGGNPDADNNYVQVVNRVYRAVSQHWIPQGYIGLQPGQWNDACNARANFRDKGSDCISASLYDKDEEGPNRLLSIAIEVEIDKHKSAKNSSQVTVTSGKILSVANRHIHNNFFTYGQEFRVPFDKGVYNMKVTSMLEGLRDIFGVPSTSPNMHFGYVAPSTLIRLYTADPNSMRIMQGAITSPDTTLIFEVSPEHRISTLREEGYPKMVDAKSLESALIQELKDIPSCASDSLSVNVDSLGTYLLTFRTAYDPLMPTSSDNFYYLVEEGQSIDLLNTSDHIALIKGNPKTTTAASVEIVSAKKLDEDGNATDKTPEWIDVSAVIAELKEIKDAFLWLQQRTIRIDGAELRVKFTEIEDDPADTSTLYRIQQHWIFDKDADISIARGHKVAVPLIENGVAYDSKEVTLELEIDSSTRHNVPEEKILKELKKHVGKKISEESEFTLNIDGFPAIDVTVKEITFFQKPPSKPKYDILGAIADTTQFKLTTEDDDLKIIPPFPDRLLKEPEQFLEEFGVGGMTKECIDHLKKVVLMRSKAKKLLQEAGVKPPKGMMLAGPPGTGKTNLAQKLGKILGIPESNITLKIGSEIFNKWVGNSEKNVRKMFQAALDEFEKYGNESSPFLLIIDEIDAMLGTRDDSGGDVRNSVVAQFIGLVDGLQQFDNIFIIGVTNRIDNVDPAVKRPGRLNPTITVGLPDFEGRHSIFRIHTKNLSNKNQIHDNVDFKKLSQLTDKMTGADIAAIVQEAYMSWVLRIANMPDDEATLEKPGKLKLQMKDFEKALEKIKAELNNKVGGPPPYWYI